MKLTTMKISIPVLMLMMFQSGHGMNAWFDQALSLFDKGQTAQAIRIIHANEPSAIKVTDSSQIPAEIERIIDGTEDRINGWWDSIKTKVADFAPRGLVDNQAFQNGVVDALLELDDVDVQSVQDVWADSVFGNLFVTVNDGWLGSKLDVCDEISKIIDTWKTSDVPQCAIAGEIKTIPESLLGTQDTDAGTIKKFIADYNGAEGMDDAEATRAEALSSLLTAQHLDALDSADAEDKGTVKVATYNAVKAAIDEAEEAGDDDAAGYADGTTAKEAAVYEALSGRADGVRENAIPEKADAKVHWSTLELPEAWKIEAKNTIDGAWTHVEGGTPEEKANSLREYLYNDSSKILAEGLDPDPEDEDTHGYLSSGELSYYLSLFGYWSIDGNKNVADPDEKETFLQRILSAIETNISANEGANKPGTPERAAWVADAANAEAVKSGVEGAVYSVFGAKYEDLLRRSSEPSSDDLSDLVKAEIGAIDGSVDVEGIRAAIDASIEGQNFDDATAAQIVEWVNNIKNATPAQ